MKSAELCEEEFFAQMNKKIELKSVSRPLKVIKDEKNSKFYRMLHFY